MSVSDGGSEAEEQVFRTEADVSVNRKATVVAALGLLVFLVGGLWSWGILVRRTRGLYGAAFATVPLETHLPEVGMVIKTLYDVDTRWQQERLEQRRTLESW